MGIESEHIMNQISAVAREAWENHPTTQFEDVANKAWGSYKKQPILSRKVIRQAQTAARKAWREHPITQAEDIAREAWGRSEGYYGLPIDWLAEARLYAQSEFLLIQLLNSNLLGAPAEGINFLKQPYENGKVGACLILRYEGVNKQLADMGIESISYENQPQLFASQKGEIRWLKVNWNNDQGEHTQDLYEFSGLSVKKRVVRYKNGMSRTEVSDQKLNQEDFDLVRTILGNMSEVVEKLNAAH